MNSFRHKCSEPHPSCSYQTMPQKIVQARVWAQGLTIGIIIAAGIITSSQRAKNRSDEDDPRFRHLVSGSQLRTALYLLNTEETSSFSPRTIRGEIS